MTLLAPHSQIENQS